MQMALRLVLSLTSALVLVAATSTLVHATVQEAFICTLSDGKTGEDVAGVAAEFKQAIADLEGGDAYEVQILTPIVSDNLSSVIWIGQMPSFSALAAFSESFGGSEAAEMMTPKFEAVMDCGSRSIWQVN